MRSLRICHIREETGDELHSRRDIAVLYLIAVLLCVLLDDLLLSEFYHLHKIIDLKKSQLLGMLIIS